MHQLVRSRAADAPRRLLHQATLRRHGRTTNAPTNVSADALDMLAILRASQALSSETRLVRLEERVVALLRTMTGATQVRLVVPIHSQGAFAAHRLDAATLIAGRLAVSLDNARLFASLEHKVAERTQALEALNRQLEVLSLTDALTGLANRRRFTEVLDTEWRRALRHDGTLALALIDIDQFKRYSDLHGHLGGDDGLRRVAQSLAGGVRPASDLAARYVGEEFAIVLPETDLAGARATAERLRAGVEALHIPHARSMHGMVTISITAFVPAQLTRSPMHLELADAALYEAKRAGRNRIEVAKLPG